jgi:signal transduction histidine kinase
MSRAEAQDILVAEPAIAVALIDVVMETDDAGLRLVDFIRNKLKNHLIRLIIRTGQPGMAPEKEVIERYDIDDYKEKTDLTSAKLNTMVRLALKSYHDITTLENNRKALRKIINAAPELYQPQSVSNFFQEILIKIIGLCNLSANNPIATVKNALVITNNNQPVVRSGIGRFAGLDNNPELETIINICSEHILGKSANEPLPKEALLIPLEIHEKILGFVYLENAQHLSSAYQDLVYVMAQQCASALENLLLYLELKEANRQMSHTLTIAEQARNMAESASCAKTTFLANMSHELRTPLNAILGYSDIIHEDVKDLGHSDILPDISKIQIAGKQLLAIVSDILDISKIEAEKLELHFTEFAVADLIGEIVTTIQPIINNNDNTFIVEHANELGTMSGDNQKIKQILLNLLHNAARFTKNGQITFTITRCSSIEPLLDGKEWLQFQVADTGIGIAKERLDKIFDAFNQVDNSTTREYGGTGLGLTICKHFCQAMDGNISIQSTLGEGSVFTVRLANG